MKLHPVLLSCMFVFSCVLTTSSANGENISFASVLDGPSANAGAGTGSAGTGSATATLDDVSLLFSWSGSFTGLGGDFSVAHFHGPALPDANAGVAIGIAVTTDLGLKSGSFAGSATLTAPQAAELQDGLWYINIHSSTSPGGEIRGQVNAVPEPTGLIFLGLGLVGIATRRRR